MLKKLTERSVTKTKQIARERSAADVCSIMCTGFCVDPDSPRFDMNIDLRLNP